MLGVRLPPGAPLHFAIFELSGCGANPAYFKSQLDTPQDMDQIREIRIGGRDAECVSIRRTSRTGSEGWFKTEIEVQCDGWKGKFGASFMQGELTRFADEIQTLYKELRGEATLEPIEPHLTLSLTGDGIGHIRVVGTAENHLGHGTRLAFTLEIDQT